GGRQGSAQQPTRYQRQQGAGRGRGKSYVQGSQSARLNAGGRRETQRAQQLREAADELDVRWGYARHTEGSPRLGWLFNMLPTTIPDVTGHEKSGLDLYFLEQASQTRWLLGYHRKPQYALPPAQDGCTFKATVFYRPYMYACVAEERHAIDAAAALRRRFEDSGVVVTVVDKEDLDLPNHLSGKLRRLLKLEFDSVADMMEVKQQLLPIVRGNEKRADVQVRVGQRCLAADPMRMVVELREYDVPYTVRCSIDLDIRVGAWYMVTPDEHGCRVDWQRDMVEKAEPRTLAFDIECTKTPLKFPNVEMDEIFMISYMVDGHASGSRRRLQGGGHLIISRTVVSEDIADFEYTPKPRFKGPFTIANEPDEAALIRRFFQHVRELRPQILVTYNGDYFDWPFLEGRAQRHGVNMKAEIGIGPYRGQCCVHLDAFYWVKRDSYLPQGAQGLKAVTRYKLGYDPVEVDPEDMVRFAAERPTEMASYSVSDAVATFYLYETYVHLFVFSLCTIIPMGAEDVLRKGSGTLCEALLMVEAFRGNILCPNKHQEPLEKFCGGQLLESETYIGGHVECLETGVFRSDLPVKFRLTPAALQQLLNNLDRDLTFAVEVEAGKLRADVANYDEVRAAIAGQLEALRDAPVREEAPLIYHLDVAAMYPNIILSNRLQPSAIVNNAACAACDFNQESSDCKRPLSWMWRGDMAPASRSEYEGLKTQLSYESVGGRPYLELPAAEQARLLKARVKDYCGKVYKKSKVTREEERVDTVCMRENPFYVNTVRAFRDRRYEYKTKTKCWKRAKAAAESEGDPVARKAAEDKELLYDSLQLAHKCILNSFYGYVMRKGARWRSMEMAGIVTYTGAQLITQARELVEQVGRPLELDTDGIWCILPASFPENFSLELRGGGTVALSYPCAMLNADVHERYTNHQYQELVDPAARRYAKRSECSIFFEVDGPYRCMVLPSSTEEGKLLKKRYAVFNPDGTLAELKGFELKRRGELELIKTFQGQVFEMFLNGTSLEECYESVASVANHWLDVLESRGVDLDDDELMELISENKTISQTLEDYGSQKGTSLTTARRLADFLGAEMVKDKGLNCRLVIASRPHGAAVTDRAIPTAIFSAEPSVKKHYLRKWLKDPSMADGDFDVRAIIDWGYYAERLGKCVQKIITIPAAMQKVTNPVPRVAHPDWLQKRIRDKNDTHRQTHIDALFKAAATRNDAAAEAAAAIGDGMAPSATVTDIEDGFGAGARKSPGGGVICARVHKRGSPVGGKENGGVGGGGGGGGATISPAGKAGSGGGKDNEAAAELPCPKRSEDFQGWLAFQKQRWRKRRQERKRARKSHQAGLSSGRGSLRSAADGGVGGAGGAGKRLRAGVGAGGVEAYIRSAQQAVMRSVWQIMEVREGDSPGEVVVWAMVGPSDLQRIAVAMPRTFYVNSRVEPVAGMGRRVTKRLPRNRPALFLTEVSLSEDGFRRAEREISGFQRHPTVEGVYELGTPALFRAVVQLGCLARVGAARRMSAGSGFGSSNHGLSGGDRLKIEELESVASLGTEVPYLHPRAAHFRRAFLYHSESGRRATMALFFVGGFNDDLESDGGDAGDSSGRSGGGSGSGGGGSFGKAGGGGGNALGPGTAEATIWFVEGKGAEARPPMQRVFEEYAGPGAGTCSFVTKAAPTVDAAWAALDATLAEYGRRKRGVTLVLAQTGLPPPALRRRLPALREFPLVPVPAAADDANYPALSWRLYAAQRLVQRFLRTPVWLRQRLARARYAHVPIGNVGDDAPVAMADAIFARQLRHNRHVLWASPSARPDLGGAEADENDAFCEELLSPVICRPGAYRSICIELDVYALSVAAVAAAAQLDVLEGTAGAAALATVRGGSGAGANNGGTDALFGGGGAGEDDAAAGGGSDDAAVAGTFKVLRLLVTAWLGDVVERGSVEADELLQHFYRWLCARQALLFDPALHRLVHRLMQKVFARLVAELQRLGACVVFASFNKVIIATNKADLASAREYAAFVVATVTSCDLFAVLQLMPRTYWEQFIFLDEENYGGIVIDDVAADDGGGGGAGGMGDDAVDGGADGDDGGEGGDGGGEKGGGGGGAGGFCGGGSGASAMDVEPEEVDEFADEEEEPPLPPEAVTVENVDVEDAEENAEDSGAKKDDRIVFNFTLAEYLTPAGRLLFLELVAKWLYEPREKLLELVGNRKAVIKALSTQLTLSQPDGIGCAGSIDGSSAGSGAAAVREALRREEEAEEDSMAEFMHDFVSRHLTERVLAAVPQILRESGTGPDAFPRLAGSWREMTNPALEFVKSLCHVMALDASVSDDVERLRKQALLELGVRPFSSDAEFVDPCLSFTLPDVICAHCNLCRGIDLCRDPAVTCADPAERWRCVQCGHRYDLRAVELALVDVANRRATHYQLQDLRCIKCRAVATSALSATCRQCAGALRADVTPEMMHRTLLLLRQLAAFHGFEWLAETVERLLWADGIAPPE
ncbi:unnamed protein product, partial [Phaeothamnion confervicola]